MSAGISKGGSDIHRGKDKRILIAAVAVIVVVVVVLSVLYIVPALKSKNSDVVMGQYMKISNSDLLSNNTSAIYFISWYGCPYGADNSWVLYDLINSTKNISGDVVLHTSAPFDFYNNTPALLFLGSSGMGSYGMNTTFSLGGVSFNFESFYMYNQTLTGTVKNTPINSTDLTSVGLSELKATLPLAIYNTAMKYQTQVKLQNYSKPIADVEGHLVTMEIITGPNGAFVHFGFMFQPDGVIRTGPFDTSQGNYGDPMSSSYVFSHYKNMTGINSGKESLIDILTTVNAACLP
ncbi:MAG: DUF929 domain-containing protein [Candidatus Thermoplasmatota archaeon]|nr:DUF929 domain-containing protein [Candidatus Thermoplasmatota archaeon]